MKYSIVMPVYKRSKIIRRCIESIENQILKPLEVIIVDNNSEIIETNKLKVLIKETIKRKILKIHYIKSPKNSGAIARNLGAFRSRGDIVAFLDSDVILDKNYYSILSKYFKEKKDLIAIQGVDKALIEAQLKHKKSSFFSKIIYYSEQFFENSLLLNRKFAYVSPSLTVAHPPLDEEFEISSQWISTCAGLFKRNLFEKYSFPNEFITYSNNEYLMFSYNLYLNKMGEMIYTNKAKYRDIQTNSGRISRIALMYQIQVYDLYILLRIFKINPLSILIFIKSRIGHLLYNICSLYVRGNFSLRNFFHAIFSIIYPLINFPSIWKGDLSFYERDFYSS
tara:strand:+ start:380 stop:1390 length:1011 start_codon:yes stop_codon:yes gene_type:complete